MYARLFIIIIIIILKLLTWATLKKKRGATTVLCPTLPYCKVLILEYIPVAPIRLPQPLHEPRG